MKLMLLAFSLLVGLAASSQPKPNLPVYNKEKLSTHADWLIEQTATKTQLFRTEDGKLVLSNGIVSRTFTTKPNCATVSLDLLSNNESFLRSVRPEAELTIDGLTFAVGGLVGQPIQNYLLPEWINQMTADPASFKLKDYRVEETKERFPWKKRTTWMPKDMPWPAPGKELIFTYQLDEQAINLIPEHTKFAYLKDIEVSVHYELYDQMPVFSKWVTVENKSSQSIRINRFKSEILAATEPESNVDNRKSWTYPNITVETDYNFGGMTDESILESSVAWNLDPLYKTQVNYERNMPCLLEVYPKYGPDQELAPGKTFSTYRAWELLHDSWDRERKGLEHRRMMRAMAPWATENPILMHVRSAETEAVKKAIDQCAEVGFEKVIMTFGSGFNTEDASPENLERMKMLADYAHSKGITLGGYSLLASRSIDKENDVVMPAGKTPRFGNSPCIESKWGQDYFKQLYNFYEKTGLDNFEHDGSYPGDICASTVHPGHRGLEDSQWNQYQRITDFYKWCRSKGIYLNVPDYYFLSGSNKTGMGYRETNWSLPREQQEIIERQNIYDGTWHKSPSMGWMFVPLVEYQGGGQAATIEPLKEHLPHYEQRLANLFGAGVQACYRGPQLFDAPETKAIVAKWVAFYKTHRRILDGDIIHIRRADGRDYDAILHVDPQGTEKGLLMIYNPLNEPIKRKINVNLYYTGLKNRAKLTDRNGKVSTLPISTDNHAWIDVEVPAKSQSWYIFSE
ncbi:MAG: hypothetical protein JZU47_12190 [Prolixibacteraceae bacterium]|nr:hypothetical protein [Prolixibacteraceae bacterium]